MKSEKCFMLLPSGKYVDLFNFKVEDVVITDMAHNLANICRFGGGTKWHYSVGQHSVLMSYLGEPTTRLKKLVHDSPEYVLSDVIRPFKYADFMIPYRELEENIFSVICEALGIDASEDPEIKELDRCIVTNERHALFDYIPNEVLWYEKPALPNVEIHKWTPAEAEAKFLGRYYELRYELSRKAQYV